MTPYDRKLVIQTLNKIKELEAEASRKAFESRNARKTSRL